MRSYAPEDVSAPRRAFSAMSEFTSENDLARHELAGVTELTDADLTGAELTDTDAGSDTDSDTDFVAEAADDGFSDDTGHDGDHDTDLDTDLDIVDTEVEIDNPYGDAEPVAFTELGLPEALVKKLAENGVQSTFPIQAATIPDALAGRHVLGKAQTGSGKTLAFGL